MNNDVLFHLERQMEVFKPLMNAQFRYVVPEIKSYGPLDYRTVDNKQNIVNNDSDDNVSEKMNFTF